jgi:hypothetical protein
LGCERSRASSFSCHSKEQSANGCFSGLAKQDGHEDGKTMQARNRSNQFSEIHIGIAVLVRILAPTQVEIASSDAMRRAHGRACTHIDSRNAVSEGARKEKKNKLSAHLSIKATSRFGSRLSSSTKSLRDAMNTDQLVWQQKRSF